MRQGFEETLERIHKGFSALTFAQFGEHLPTADDELEDVFDAIHRLLQDVAVVLFVVVV